MMSGVSRCIVVASLICGFASAQTSAPPAAVKPELSSKILNGTLFNTREQRERLDRTRLLGGVIEDEVTATAEPARSVINGFVKRSDGRDTVWVDDVMKRDPRAEVVERLEPNVVGGMPRGMSQLTATSLQSKPFSRNAITPKRQYSTVKSRHSKKARLSRSFKSK